MSAITWDAPVESDCQRRIGRRLLLVAYAFPPVGGAGVQRPLKWVKYLRRAGWHVTVLTPENPSVPVRDESLLEEVPDDTVFLRPRTREPSYRWKQQLNVAATPSSRRWAVPKRWLRQLAGGLLQPDPQILWYGKAVDAATRHLRLVPHDAVLVTAPPFSSFLIGAALRRRCQTPLILDYRDEWDLSNRYLEHASRAWLSRVVQERMQRSVLRAADAVIATTRASERRLQERILQAGSRARTACIYNGYDEDDLEPSGGSPAIPHVPTGCFRIVYTGTLWNLTSIEPLIQGLELLHQRSPAAAAQIELACIGRKTPEQQAYVDRLKRTTCRVLDIGYSSHDAVIAWLRSADAVCLLLSDVPGADRVVPAKLFEYLALHKPILACLPDGESCQLVDRYAQAGFFRPASAGALAEFLANIVSRRDSADWNYPLEPSDVTEFSRERQTERLRALLEDVVSQHGTGETR
jgi:glycosyltransferase involved in cell wall biosynthesis